MVSVPFWKYRKMKGSVYNNRKRWDNYKFMILHKAIEN
jgi:hypothetical protein